jgi:hypothetical protein
LGIWLFGPALCGRGSHVDRCTLARHSRPLGNDRHAPTGSVEK